VDDQPPQVSADGVELLCDGRGFLRVAHPLPPRDPELKYKFGRGTVRIVEKAARGSVRLVLAVALSAAGLENVRAD